jgi:hypothetical protein
VVFILRNGKNQQNLLFIYTEAAYGIIKTKTEKIIFVNDSRRILKKINEKIKKMTKITQKKGILLFSLSLCL